MMQELKNKKILVTGSAGHLGEALMRTLAAPSVIAPAPAATGPNPPNPTAPNLIGTDILPSPFTTAVGSITDRAFVRQCLKGVKIVFHTATLHKPHVATHTAQEFIDTNLSGTLNLLEESVAAGVEVFIFTSTTSVFGDALVPDPGLPAAWITEEVRPVPKNIYGVTKAAAEDLCQLYHRNHGLPCIILRTSRFFPEADDSRDTRDRYTDDNAKLNEYLFRRVELEDAVTAHLAAAQQAKTIGHGRYIISATTPFRPEDLALLRTDAPAVLQQLYPDYPAIYDQLSWTFFPSVDRVYVNTLARQQLGWQPRYDFRYMLDLARAGAPIKSEMAKQVGAKGYHSVSFDEGPYPTS